MRPRNNIDQDLYQDRLTHSTIRHPVVGSDGGVYEASSYLQILQHAGMSLINPVHRLTSAVRVPAIESTIDMLFNNNEDRNDEYDIHTVMTQIQQLLGENAQGNNMQRNQAAFVLGLGFMLELSSALSGATCYLSVMMGLFSMFPVVQMVPFLLYAALSGQSLSESVGGLLHLLEKTILVSGAAFVVSELGLFGGRKAGIFPEREHNHRHNLR